MRSTRLVCACLVLSVLPLRAQDQMDLNVELREFLHDGEWAVHRGRLRDAHAALARGREALAAKNAEYGAWRHRTLMAELYIESGDFDEARQELSLARKQLDALPRRDEQGIRRDRQTLEKVSADLEDAERALCGAADRDPAVRAHADTAARRLEAALAIPDGMRLADPAWEMHILQRLAVLNQLRGDQAAARDTWARLRTIATAVHARNAPREAPTKAYEPTAPLLESARALAACSAASGQVADAARELASIADTPIPAALRGKLLAEIATLYQRAGDPAGERRYLELAARTLEPLPDRDEALVAQLHGRLALSIEAEAGEKQALPEWTKCAERLESARQRLPQRFKDDPERQIAHGMLCLQQLQAVYQHVERYDDAVRAGLELLRLRDERLLENDPRPYRSRTALATFLVKLHRYDEARPLAEAAAGYWSKREPAEPDVYVRTLIALAEVQRNTGDLRGAAQTLDRAEEYSKAASAERISDRARMALALNRGLLLSEQGMYQKAIDGYQFALEVGEKLGSSANELRGSALLNLAMVYKSQLQFGPARDYCDRAVKERLEIVPADDRRMLPYYIATSGLDIAQRNVELLAASLDRSWKVCQAHRLTDQIDADVAMVWHQRAMLHYLKNEAAPNSSDRDAARDAWQKVLAIDERLDTLDLRARTLHYLSKLKYVDWTDHVRAWRAAQARTDQPGQPPDALATRVAEYDRQSKDFLARAKKYEETLHRYNSARDAQSATAEEFATLKREFDAVRQEEKRLEQFLAELSRDHEREKQRHLDGLRSHDVEIQRLAAELREAMELAREAAEILDRTGAFPNLQYAALCHHGQLLWSLAEWGAKDDSERDALKQAAIAQVAGAVRLIETPRSMTTGGDIARAEFFSNYATAFDLLVAWHADMAGSGRADSATDALYYAELGRNRTFLDQVRASEVDVRDSLPEASKHLVAQERDLLARHGEAVARVRALGAKRGAQRTADDERQLAAARHDLDVIRDQYAAVRGQIYDANPAYRGLIRAGITKQDVLASLAAVASDRRPLLYYYVGQNSSHLFLVGSDAAKTTHYPIEIPQAAGAAVSDASRQVSGKLLVEFVNRYREVISNADRSKAMLRGGLEDAEKMVVTSKARISYLALTDMLLPPAAREAVRTMQPEYATIIPDGALHHLPFEALPLSDRAGTKFVLDDFPALAYAPSAMILQTLEGANRDAPRASHAALTIGNPAFHGKATAEKYPVKVALATEDVTDRFAENGMPLVDLPGALVESRNVQAAFVSAFGNDNVVSLTGTAATEGRFRQELGKRSFAFIHLATHGLVEERVFNLFGAIALAKPDASTNDPADDGFLALHEIHGLRLSGCELAVLSACQTNVGPARPMETSSTFARAFLSAGARRVVSSQWRVNDESTGALVQPFLAGVVRSFELEGSRPHYAVALQTARKAIRDKADWSAPFYWAPFVLVGPGE